MPSSAYNAVMEFPGYEPGVVSKLTQRFGKETLNYYSGTPLNRLSFLRSKTPFLRRALLHGNFLLFKNLNALTSLTDPSHLVFLNYENVKAIVEGAYDVTEEEKIKSYNSSLVEREESEGRMPTILFLGCDEEYTVEKERGEVVVREKFEYEGGYKGRPYFAIDVSKPKVEESLQKAGFKAESELRSFQSAHSMQLVPKEASILAQARSLLDWNARHQFCSACGRRTISTYGGTKRTCPPTDLSPSQSAPSPHPPCVSLTGIHNISFPRTDPTVIMAILSPNGTHVLLGRKSVWPPHFYSTLAGFVDSAESIEDAVRRETWEESGIRVGRVVIHSSQPWPFPASLMIGCIGEALPGGDEIQLGHDPELEDARWIGIQDLKMALKRNSKSIDEKPLQGYKKREIRLPPATAIAHQLLRAVVEGYHLPPKM